MGHQKGTPKGGLVVLQAWFDVSRCDHPYWRQRFLGGYAWADVQYQPWYIAWPRGVCWAVGFDISLEAHHASLTQNQNGEHQDGHKNN